METPYIFAIGRCADGLKDERLEVYKGVKIVFLLLASKEENSYLSMLASLAKTLQNDNNIRLFEEAKTTDEFREKVLGVFKGVTTKRGKKDTKFNQLLLRKAVGIAKAGKCDSIFIFGDTFTSGLNWDSCLDGFKTVLITQRATEVSQKGNHAIIPVRLFSSNRLSQLRSAILIGLSHGIIKHDERLCCLGGIHQSDKLDSLVIVDVKQEIQSVFSKESNMLPETVKPEILERLIAIATELAIEGREGRPVGCFFVLGEIAKLKPYIKPLVLNPFYGYKPEDRNLLNPFMDETIKEYSSLDGAFIVGGDGLLESAGSMVHAPAFAQDMPSGLGTRHAAAAAISVAVDCIAITVSASTGQVTLFRGGEMLPLLEKGVGSNYSGNLRR